MKSAVRAWRYEEAQVAQSSERLRSRIANLTLIFFLLLPLEGLLRKWLVNSIQQPLLFIRDPIILWIYWEYFRLSGFKRRWMIALGAASIFAACFAFIQ